MSKTGIPAAGSADDVTYGTIIANGDIVQATIVAGKAGWTMGYYGTYAVGASLTMESTFNGFDAAPIWLAVRMFQGTSITLTNVLTIAPAANSSNYFLADIPAGSTHVRARCSAWAAPSGAINVVLGQADERNNPAPPSVTATVASTTITSVTPGVTATLLGKAEDAPHVSGDTGVAVWGVRNDAQAVRTSADGDYSTVSTDSAGNVFTDPALFSYAHVSTVATTVVKGSAGNLHTITVNSKGTVASTVTVYDNTAGSGTVIAVLDSLTLSGTFVFDVAFATGLTIVTTGTVAPDVTVSYR